MNETVSLESQVKVLRLRDKPRKQNFHKNIEKGFEPVTDTTKNTSEILTKTLTESSTKNNQSLENLNNKQTRNNE